jgi:hypothetical protein
MNDCCAIHAADGKLLRKLKKTLACAIHAWDG